MKVIKLLLCNPTLFKKRLYDRATQLFKLHNIRKKLTKEAARWFKDKGYETRRLDYPPLFEKYNCRVYLELHPKSFNVYIDIFANNKRVIPMNYGLSNAECVFTL